LESDGTWLMMISRASSSKNGVLPLNEFFDSNSQIRNLCVYFGLDVEFDSGVGIRARKEGK
jgi:hypothetical protein